jgi:hypothetical protein
MTAFEGIADLAIQHEHRHNRLPFKAAFGLSGHAPTTLQSPLLTAGSTVRRNTALDLSAGVLNCKVLRGRSLKRFQVADFMYSKRGEVELANSDFAP